MINLNKIILFIENKFIYCFLLLSFLMYSSLTQNTVIISFLIWPIVFFAFVVILYRLFNIRKYQLNFIHILMVLFIITYIISSFINIEYGFYQNFRLIVLMMIVLGAVFTKAKNDDESKMICVAKLFAVSSSILSFLSLLIFNINQIFLHFGETVIYMTGLRWGRLRGFYNDFNYGAIINTIAIILIIYLMSKCKKKSIKIIYIFMIFVDFIFIVLSDSRGALLALVLSLIFYYILYIKNNFKLKKNFYMLISVPLIFLVLFGARLSIKTFFANIYDKREEKVDVYITSTLGINIDITEINNYLDNDDTVQKDNQEIIPVENNQDKIPINNYDDIFDRGYSTKNDFSNRRFELWSSAIDIFKKNLLFGVSFENFENYCKKEMTNAYLINNGYKIYDNFHNIFFNILASQGLIGISIFLLFVVYFIKYFIKLCFSLYKGENYSVEKNVIIAIIIICVLSTLLIGDIVYYISPSTIIFWFLLGYIANTFNIYKNFDDYKIVRVIRKVYRIVCVRLFNLFPIKNNKIIFSNFSGKGFGDNPKYIFLELNSRKCSYDYVWILKNDYDKKTLPPNVRYVMYNSIRYFYDMCTAKIWIDNHRKIIDLKKRKEQFYIQTWHGGIALKKIEKDVENVLDHNYIKQAVHDSKMIDLMISNSEFCSKMYKRAFWYEGEILECGSPRNDIFFMKNGTEFKGRIKKKINIPLNKKIALYAPTFRKDENVDCYNIDYDKLKMSLKNKFGGEWIIALRLHPNISNKSSKMNIPKDVVDVSNYSDVYELLFISDVLLTDYSSIMYEFSLLYKPVFLFASDLNDYLRDRGLYFDYDKLPYPSSFNNEQLAERIAEFDIDKYKKSVEKFYNTVKIFDKGCASREVSNIIIDKIDGV